MPLRHRVSGVGGLFILYVALRSLSSRLDRFRTATYSENMTARKNPHAVALGRIGGYARASKLTPAQRKQSAQQAIQTRWARARECPLGKTALRQLRQKKGYTQTQLAQRAGLSLAQIHRLEVGKAQPGWFTVIRLAKALEVKEETLLAGGTE